MTVTFAAEPWAAYRADVGPIWREHYDEIAARKDRMKMAPDEAAYRALEEAGQLHVLVARDAGRIVGYMTSVVRPHLHYAGTLCGFEDAYFLTASHRRGRTPVRLFREWEKAMKGRGVQALYLMCKTLPGLDHSRLFDWLGFKMTDHCWSKWIGD